MTDFLREVLRGIEPAVFRRHLRQRGWTERESPSKRSYLATHPFEGREVEVEIPMSRNYADYTKRVLELVETLARFEGLAPTELLTLLTSPSADIVVFRYIGDETRDGTIGIDDSIRIRQARKNLLLSAAHSVVEPSLHFPRLSRTEPIEFLQRCREAPSRPGSFVSEVIVPVSPALGQLDFEEPFARRATTLLANALLKTTSSLESGDDAALLDAAASGVSANFLTALSHLKPPGSHGALEVRFRWASERPIPQSTSQELTLSSSLFEPLEEVARVLRETSKASGYELCGYVASLKRAPDDLSKSGQAVIVTTLEDRGGMSAVHVTLEPKQYEEAVEAHRAAKQVRITGTLVRSGRKLVLENPGGLVVAVSGAEIDDE